ncbi:hypothetical protein [Williamsia muralis]|uniref:Uncharacterized protein n=1 Tax=Williamsia marianensis TaxID=85044 RepID=A0A2G3PIG2_WILMA|nr:hypothetical protein [Williamsia marianensis]PHV65599.1 hypothetical protein CSW57_17805 [Williamsia marianensis]
MQVKKAFTRTVATGAIGLASLGVGGAVAEATAAPAATSSTTTQEGPTRTTTSSPGAVKRPDLATFTFRGQEVTPTYDRYKRGWGFWFFGFWVPVVL